MPDNTSKKNTKERIFEEALTLFSREGYNGVSMRQIAKAVGIKESSIYNHYKNKEEILMSLFKYFSETLTLYRPSEEEIEKMLQYMDVEDIFKQLIIGLGKSLNGTHDVIARIVYSEQFRNATAKQLMLENIIAEPARYIAKVLTIMKRKNLIKDIDINFIAEEYNYVLLALSFEYAHAANNGDDTSPIIKKMFKHLHFICEYIKL